MAAVVSSNPSVDTFDLPDDDAVRARAGALFDLGYNCSETLVRLYSEYGVIDASDSRTLEMVSTGFGKGMGAGIGNCGAMVGGILVINALFGRRLEKRRWVYKIGGQFTQLFRDRFTHVACSHLRTRKEIDCRELTCETAVLLNQFLARRLPK